ncbi:hypothetical protein KUCAC02_016125 [Chaenocephalus aceratus]|uniref:Uncharacterized protein n=1 Tax=Chaenocephalus aceratus TaxID=36190 RepID=A0ACB9XZE7_CHAAC|nr:hypothetical protein KUCAC02_016125 [Chaenocephalus aceratus]
MEKELIFSPKWHLAFCFLILMMFQAAEAEITCRSCQSGNKWRARELMLKFDTSESATGLKREVVGQGDGAGRSASAESVRFPCAAGSVECAPAPAEHTERRRNIDAKNKNVESEKMKVSNVKTSQESSPGLTFSRKRARRSSDDGEEITSPAQSQDPGEGARRVPRWSGEDRRGAGTPRHDELKVDSTTFALTGDSSHNQAMVHWSGQNSSVSDFLCPL